MPFRTAASTFGRVKRPDSQLDELVVQILEQAQRRLQEVRIPAATYRIQLNAEFPFDRAVEVVRLLLSQGADPQVRSEEGRTAEEIARERGLDLAAAALAASR